MLATALQGASYVGDDGVAIMSGDKVLDFAGRRLGELVAADEMGLEVELGGIAGRGAVGGAIDLGSSGLCVGHVGGRGHAVGEVVRWKERGEGGSAADVGREWSACSLGGMMVRFRRRNKTKRKVALKFAGGFAGIRASGVARRLEEGAMKQKCEEEEVGWRWLEKRRALEDNGGQDGRESGEGGEGSRGQPLG